MTVLGLRILIAASGLSAVFVHGWPRLPNAVVFGFGCGVEVTCRLVIHVLREHEPAVVARIRKGGWG